MTKHTPGKFVWFELLTADPDKARSFYTQLLGWTVEAVDMGGFHYPMIKLGAEGPAIGGIMPAQGEAQSHWVSYLSVEDVDAAAARVEAAGGRLHGKPSDMPGVGKMVRVADPQGAHLFLFKGADGDPEDGDTPNGGFYWNELWARDGAEASRFYASLVPWATESMDMPTGEYFVAKTGETPRAGLMSSPVDGVPPSWLPYMRVSEVEARVRLAESLGAEVVAPVSEVPGVGKMAILRGPTGSSFALITPAQRS